MEEAKNSLLKKKKTVPTFCSAEVQYRVSLGMLPRATAVVKLESLYLYLHGGTVQVGNDKEAAPG